MTHDDRNVQDFEERFRQWAQRPPETAPEDAARRVIERLPDRRPVFQVWHGLAAAAVLVLVAASWLRFGPGIDPAPPPPVLQAEVDEPVHSTDSDEVLMWLDESTPLYMTFAPSGQEGNDS